MAESTLPAPVTTGIPDQVAIDKDKLGTKTTHLGELIGLLTPDNDDNDKVDLQTGWFADALTELENSPRRVAQLIQVIEDYLGAGVKEHPEVPDSDAQWFSIPNLKTGKATGWYLITPKDGATAGEFGLGCFTPYDESHLKVEPFLYLPLFDLSTDAPQWVLTSTSHSCQLGLAVSKDDGSPFSSTGGVTFTSMVLSADVYLADQVPGFTLDFTELKGTGEPASYTSLSSLKASTDAQAWIGTVITTGAPWLNKAVGTTKLLIGDLFVAAKLLKQVAAPQGALIQYQLSLDELEGEAESIAKTMLQNVLAKLSDPNNNPLVKLSNGGVYGVAEDAGNGGTNYSLRLVMADIALTEAKDEEGSKPSPGLALQLGKWLRDETNEDSWVARSLGATAPDPGVTVRLLNEDSSGDPAFSGGIELNSLGFDLAGGANTPLFDISGYTLHGAELRGYLVIEDGSVAYGFGGSFDDISLPLGPAFGSSSSSGDKVAESLLSSETGDENSDSGDAINPSCSLSAAWVEKGTFVVQLYDKDGNASDSVWIPMQRAFGPLHCRKVGFGWVQSETRFSLLFDGSVDLEALDIDLQGLSIGVPITHPGDLSQYKLGLEGLGATLNGEEVKLSGDLAKLPADTGATPPRDWPEYDGDAMVQVGNFSLAAVGSYAYAESGGSGYASLFLFAILDDQLGDPTGTGGLYITGLSAGFGFNRSIVMPGMDAVPDFPLVAAAQYPSALGATQNQDGSWAMPSAGTALAKMEAYLPPERGEYWLAAGVRFTSFDLVNSNALFTFSIGKQLEVGILGLSWTSLPPPSAPGAAKPAEVFAYGELEIEVKLLPEEGELAATAVLAPNSFVIDPACKLSGAYAFYSWFGNSPHTGQFVLTLGGYHPNFTPPSYFPKVPRLAFNWPLSGEVTIHGDAYYALTPSAAMAGGGLEVLYHSGELQAWFKAEMNALVVWAPFHYELDISVRIGVSYRLHLVFLTKTYKLELGAALNIWGPKTGGKVHVNWTIISFTVAFGASSTGKPAALGWTDDNGNGFAQTLLPNKTSTKASAQSAAPAATAAPGAICATQPTSAYTVSANAGVKDVAQQTVDGKTLSVWIVRPKQFQWTVQTTIPCTEIDLTKDAKGGKTEISADADSIGVRPMDTTLTGSVLTVTLTYLDENEIRDLGDQFTWSKLISSVPAAKWGEPLPDGTDPGPNETVDDQLMGLTTIQAKAPTLSPTGSDALDIELEKGFGFDPVEDTGTGETSPHPFPLNPNASATGSVPSADAKALSKIADTIAAANVVSARSEIFTTLRSWGIDPGTDGDLGAFAASPASYLDGDPLILEAA